MSKTHHVKTPMHIALWDGGGEVEIDAIISFVVTAGTKPTYDDPGSAPEVDITKFSLSSSGEIFAECPVWLRRKFESDSSFINWLVEEARYRNEAEADDAADANRKARAA